MKFQGIWEMTKKFFENIFKSVMEFCLRMKGRDPKLLAQINELEKQIEDGNRRLEELRQAWIQYLKVSDWKEEALSRIAFMEVCSKVIPITEEEQKEIDESKERKKKEKDEERRKRVVELLTREEDNAGS